MSNTKQQIKEILTSLDSYYHENLTDDEVLILYPELRKAVDAIDRLVTEARMNELEMLPHKVFDCSPLIHLGYTFDEHTDRIAELQSQLNEEQK